MLKKLLIISQAQYGYLIDYTKYCEYLKNDFNITYLCWDYGNKKIKEPNIKIIYVFRNGNIITRNVKFISFIIKHIKETKYDIIFISYFRGSSLIPLNFKKNIPKIHLDIRTGNISKYFIKRFIYNNLLRIESNFFNSISLISNGLQKFLGIHESAIILPLGATFTNINHNSINKLHLLYVGTFSNRRLEDTIYGMKLFLSHNPTLDITYTIIGDGLKHEIENLQNIINKLDLQGYIKLTGYIPHKELIPYYEKANVGISFIPMTSYFDFQPATKTFEYLMAGMPVIATKTYSNKEIIKKENGILIDDDPVSFAEGINHMYKHLESFDKEKIIESVEKYEWRLIIQTMKKDLLA